MSIGLTTASVGMSGVVFSQINDLFFKTGDTYSFLMFISIAMSAGVFLGSFFLGPLDNTKSIHSATDYGSILSAEEKPISGVAFLKHPIGYGLFATLFVVLGAGYVYLTNIWHILNALPSVLHDQHALNLQITLFSLGNCGARVVFGAVSDVLKNKFGIHRLWIFVLASISNLFILIYLVYATNITNLTPCTLIVSISFGMVFGVGPSITSEFGAEV